MSFGEEVTRHAIAVTPQLSKVWGMAASIGFMNNYAATYVMTDSCDYIFWRMVRVTA